MNGTLPGNGQPAPSLDNKWKRASLPVADVYPDFAAAQRNHIDNSSIRHRGNSMSSANGSLAPKRRTQHYEDQLQYRDVPQSSARDWLHRESPVVAELRTNVIIKDEYTLVTDLASHLAVRYSKPDSAIMINIDHSSCLALAGTFDPCYILTITTVPSHIGPTVNKRNAALIQAFMADILSVPPDRGIIRFVAIPEENYAMNGNTMLGEADRLEKQSGIENGVKRALVDARKSMPVFKRSTTDVDLKKSGASVPERDNKSEKDVRAARRRSGVAPASNEVFELAAESDGRPSTSHGQSFAAENGLRMNGVSKDDLVGKNAHTPNGRPKTIAAPSSSTDLAADAMPALKQKHISAIVKSEQKVAHMPPSSKPTSSNRPASIASKHSAAPSRKTDQQPLTPVTLKETIVDNPKVLKPDSKFDNDTAANTAKRRSTITATPKMPAPPPVPDSKTPKVSKRKSFLSAFRR